MFPGQEATVEIDTYPDADCHGKVTSLSPGTGLTFSLLPPENATGNWVKVVQSDCPCGFRWNAMTPIYRSTLGSALTVNVDKHTYQRPWMACGWSAATIGSSERRERLRLEAVRLVGGGSREARWRRSRG